MLSPNRREFVKGLASAAVAGGTAARAASALGAQASSGRKSNIILYIADQMRWDFVGAMGLNPSVKTPNLDKIAAHGILFAGAVTNQPLCAPSRACMLTGRYATANGVWKNDGPMLDRNLPTLAGILRENGYTANFVGKWHLGPTRGPVAPEYRAGFLDFWEGSNLLENTSHPYQGTIWDSEGNAIKFDNQYRVDFITDRALHFLKQPQEKPFLLQISQLEPHFQNDMVRFVAPKGYAERYQNAYVPPDLRPLPGDWQAQLPDYYGCVESIDESVGRILQTLEETGQLDNTIFLFTSDHGCHFRTRNMEYKRSPHDSSIRIPLIMRGPGFDLGLTVPQITGNINMTPTLLEAAGIAIPNTMQGRSQMTLLGDKKQRESWENSELIQVSQVMIGRALRTGEWTYCVADRNGKGSKDESSMNYEEYQMYNNYADPAQQINLAGRVPFINDAEGLREQLLQKVVASGEAKPMIAAATLYP